MDEIGCNRTPEAYFIEAEKRRDIPFSHILVKCDRGWGSGSQINFRNQPGKYAVFDTQIGFTGGLKHW